MLHTTQHEKDPSLWDTLVHSWSGGRDQLYLLGPTEYVQPEGRDRIHSQKIKNIYINK
jgi:hypothetical protein